VDGSAAGATHDGATWETAYLDLQAALTGAGAASAGDQVWVAEGRYTPGPAGSPGSTFSIPEGVAVYGGFAGGETSLAARDPVAHPTVLSGDLAGDDTVDARGVTLTAGGISGTNAYHVVTLNGVSGATMLEGLIITAGDARNATTRYGGGLYASGSSASLAGLTFVGNAAASGGAACFSGGAPTLTNMAFKGNLASSGAGGAVLVQDSSAPTITGALFSGNQAVDGGALASYSSSPVLTNIAMASNTASYRGGAVYVNAGSPTLTNVSIGGNTGANGTALYVGNSATPLIANSIIWGNLPVGGAPISMQGEATAVTITYSLVQGGAAGTGNLDADPLFLNVAAGDLRLAPGSPAIDAGLNAAVPEGVTMDLSGAARLVDGDGDTTATVDMGAYEYGASAATAFLSIASVDALVGSEVRVPVTFAASGTRLSGADLVLSYDPDRLTPARVELGALPSAWSLEYNLSTPGEIRVSLAGSSPVESDGELLVLVFTAGEITGSTELGWVSASLNEGLIEPTLSAGGVALCAATEADLAATPTTGPAPLEVAFTSLATGGFETFAWTFGDGGTSTEANPVHTYTVPGVYDVSLTVSGPGGSATTSRTAYITVYAPAVAAFGASPVDGLAPLTVAFTDQSQGDISAYVWDFGDGSTSDVQSPSHTYETEATYTVSLTVSGDGGTSTVTHTNLITVRLGTIAGAVHYWQGERPVAGAAVGLAGDATASTATATDGTYALDGLRRGHYAVAPGDGAALGDAISPYDASLVLRHAAGLLTLSGPGYTAADVTLNGSATAYDASYTLRAAAGLIPLASPAAGVAWRFEPASRGYPDFTDDVVGQDYTALVLGDVSGNWGAEGDPGLQALAPVAELTLEVGAPEASGLVTATFRLVSTEAPLYSLSLELSLGAEATVVDVHQGERAPGWLLAHNTSEPGGLRLAMAGSQAADAAGPLAHLTFQLPPGQRTLTLLPLATEIDEGAIGVRWSSGDLNHRLYLPLARR